MAKVPTRVVNFRTARAQSVLCKAAGLLDSEADALKACSTLNGDWGDEESARQDYEEMTQVAQDLRMICGDKTKKECE